MLRSVASTVPPGPNGWHRSVCVCMLSVVAFAASAGNAASEDPNKLVAEALRLAGAGRIDEAIGRYEHVLPTLPDAAASPGLSKVDVLLQLSRLHRSKSNWGMVEASATRGLELCRANRRCADLQVASLEAELGTALLQVERISAAKASLLRAIELAASAGQPGAPLLARANNNLAELFQRLSDCKQALAYYSASRDIQRKTPRFPALLASFPYLGMAKCQIQLARLGDAEQSVSTAWTLVGDSRMPDIPEVFLQRMRVLAVWGEVLRLQKRFPEAVARFKQGRDLSSRSPNADVSAFASLLNGEALAYVGMHDFETAELRIRQALELLREGKRSRDDFERASIRASLGHILMLAGKLESAARESEVALVALRSLAPPGHPAIAAALDNLTAIALARKDGSAATRWEHEASDAEDEGLRLALAFGDEEHKLLYLRAHIPNISRAVTIAAFDPSPMSVGTALEKVLNRRGLVQDILARSLALTCGDRAGADAVARCERYRAAAERYAAELHVGAARIDAATSAERIRVARQEFRKSQEGISDQALGLGPRVSWQEVQQSLPEGAVLVEYYVYRPFLGATQQMWGHDQLGAFILRKSGDPQFVPLSNAQQVHVLVRELRTNLMTIAESSATADGCKAASLSGGETPARRLYDAVIRPLVPLIGGASKVLVVPDGALGVVPLIALQDDNCAHLLERPWQLSYMTTGRDLVLGLTQARKSAPGSIVIIANPTFDTTPAVTQDAAAKRMDMIFRSAPDLPEARFEPLSETAEEAAAVEALYPGAIILDRERATEMAVKDLRSPRILLIASHGTFRSDGLDTAGSTYAMKQGSSNERTALEREHPLLRSAIALAGANSPGAKGGDDGLLTALEASALKLSGTELVVLSACHTGEGEQIASEGLYGLQRGFRLAGSASQLVSLWRVNSTATKDLVVDFFVKLKGGLQPAAALREAQLKMMSTDGRAHPAFWAGFVLTGLPSRPDIFASGSVGAEMFGQVSHNPKQ